MGVTLVDLEDEDVFFDTNFWNYRPLVELIRGTGILPVEKVESLHEQFVGSGLTKDESRLVAVELRTQVLPLVQDDERILLDLWKTKEPDDGVFHRSDEASHENYSTYKKTLVRFIEFLERTNGFRVA